MEAAQEIDLRFGTWEGTLSDVEADMLLTDPPFSHRIHSGQRTGSSTRKTTLIYDAMTEEKANELASSWAPRVRHWVAIFADHLAARWHESAWMDQGWYVFAPVIWLRKCPTPRLAGDGPTSACDYIVVARPKRRLAAGRSGSRPGYYISPHSNGIGFSADNSHPGGKMLAPTRSLLLDYTLVGDCVVDPYAGNATTLIAAAIDGRRSIGAEMDPETYAKAVARIKRGYTPAMVLPTIRKMKQGGLDFAREACDLENSSPFDNQEE